MPDQRYLNIIIMLSLVAFGALAFTFLNHGPGFGSSPDAFGGTLSQRWQVLSEPQPVRD
jgi:hypothetical protein